MYQYCLDKLIKLIPALSDVVMEYPCNCQIHNINPYTNRKEQQSIAGIIIHLNDGCKWSREQIADWLDSIDVELYFNV